MIALFHRRKPDKEKRRLLKLMPETLGLDDLDYLITQAAAEKIRPGVFKYLLQ